MQPTENYGTKSKQYNFIENSESEFRKLHLNAMYSIYQCWLHCEKRQAHNMNDG